MGAGGYLVPFDEIPGSVCTKYRIRRVFHIGVGVIADGGDDFLAVVADVVPGGQHRPAAEAVGVGRDLPRIAPRRRDGQAAGQPHRVA